MEWLFLAALFMLIFMLEGERPARREARKREAQWVKECWARAQYAAQKWQASVNTYEGRIVTQAEFDRICRQHFARFQAQGCAYL